MTGTRVEQSPSELVLGIDIGGTKTELALAGTDGSIVDRIRIPTLAEQGPGAALSRIVEASKVLTARTGSTVVAVGVVSPGVIQAERILLAPNLPGWERTALRDSCVELFGLTDVAVTNDVKAAGLAEARSGSLVGCDPGLYLNLGTGLGAALVVAGQVVDGNNQAAGEIAYIAPAGPDASDPRNLEDVAGGSALLRAAAHHFGGPPDPVALFADEPEKRAFVRSTLRVLATAVANMAVLLDPERIVVGGGMTASAEVILPILRDELARVAPFPPDLQLAHFTQDASLHGAVFLAIDAIDPAAHSAHGAADLAVAGHVSIAIAAGDERTVPATEMATAQTKYRLQPTE